MGKLIVDMKLSLDGYINAADGSTDWFDFSDEMMQHIQQYLENTGLIILGGNAYKLLADYWPQQNDEIAHYMNIIPKLVFDETATDVARGRYNNVRLEKQMTPELINNLKRETAKDIVVQGGAGVVQSLADMALIDEYHLWIHPIVLGGGTPFFTTGQQIDLELMETHAFHSGTVGLCYRVLHP